MKNLMRTLTLSAAALAALVAIAPKSEAQTFGRGRGQESGRNERREPQVRGPQSRGPESRGREFRGGDLRGRGFRGGDFRGQGFRGGDFRGRGFRGGDFRGQGFRGGDFRGHAFGRPPAFSYGSRYVAPFRVFAGSRFYSYCPGPDYIYVDDLGWVFPPFFGAVWVPRFDPFGVRIGGFWR